MVHTTRHPQATAVLWQRLLTLIITVLVLPSSGCLTLMGGEQKVGDQAAAQVEAEMGIVKDEALEAWVDDIGQRLVAVTKRPDRKFRFQIVDMTEPNAFALPGGHIYVSRGLLALVNTEDQLAGVIGHEIGHVVGSHASRRITLAAPFKIITGLTGWLTGILTPRVGDAIRDGGDTLTDGLLVAPYGRQQERDADRIGLKLAADAGWDPIGLSEFLDSLGRDETLRSGRERSTSWLDSHPATPERVKDTKERAASLERADRAPIAKDREAVLAKLDGLLVGDDAAGGLVVDALFIQPELGFTLGVPAEWVYNNAPTEFMAVPEKGGAAIVLKVAAAGGDLAVLERDLKEALGTKIELKKVSLGGLDGIRFRIEQKTRQGRMTIDATYFAIANLIIEVAGIAPKNDFARWSPIFDAAVDAIHPPTPEEIASLREDRLRTATATAGETLDQIADRSGSDWQGDRLAVVNGVENDASLSEGFGVKIMREEPYVPKAR
jgi:predicted Zn-dependent protease